MSPEDLADFERLKYLRSAVRVAAAALSPDGQRALVESYRRFTAPQVEAMLSTASPDEKDLARAGGSVWSVAKDFISEALGSSPSAEKVEALAESIAGRQLSGAQIEAIRSGIASRGSSTTLEWLTQLVLRVAGNGAVNALPAGDMTIVP